MRPLSVGSIVSFEQLAGQSALAARLKASLERGRIAHAVIFAGPSGSGKRTAAGIYARALLCASDREKPCNACTACRKALGGNHPDLHYVRPEEGKALGVDEARALQRLIELRPYEGGRVVVVVEKAHEMTHQAQNALLKTLEEPPEHVVLILLAESLSPLLPTILSRCAVFKMARLNSAQMMAVLRSHGCPEGARTAHAAAMADGRPGRALELLADEDYWALRDSAMRALRQAVEERRLAGPMKFVQESRARIGDVLSVWECALRDAILCKANPSVTLLTGESPEGFAFLEGIGMKRLIDMLSACAEARRALEGNAAYSLAMDRLLIEFTGGI